jgi:A/G-specific adenine glycosylase
VYERPKSNAARALLRWRRPPHAHIVRAAMTAPRLPRGARVPDDVRRRFGRRLRDWFRANGRDLPWRRTRDPYRVLVSELMLQQTQVARVLERYDEFLREFPTLGSVARSRQARVMEAWEGLGYYARARNLHTLARTVERGEGALPSDPGELRRLPGIGAYTAGAVASFAYERRAPLVDTNVARVLRRVFAPGLDPRSTRGQRTLWAIAEALLPRTGRATWVHNQAVMELGALICTARVARCDVCPVRDVCRSAKRDRAGRVA